MQTHHPIAIAHLIPVANPLGPEPLTAFDWQCCFCYRNNNEAQHPFQCTNPACLHVRVRDNRPSPAERGTRTTSMGMIYSSRLTRTNGVEVCPDCTDVAYTFVDGRGEGVR